MDMRTGVAAVALLGLMTAAPAALAQTFTFRKPLNNPAPVAADAPGAPPRSCKALKERAPATASGLHQIDPDGAGGVAPFTVRCEMTAAGGGWTLVVAQFESDPAPNWNEGLQADYDPSLASGRGFALDQGRIPAHAEVGFGHDTNPVFLERVPFQYTTGPIPDTTVVGASGRRWTVLRRADGYYGAHNPSAPFYADASYWGDALSLSEVGTVSSSGWAFSPRPTLAQDRGHHLFRPDGTFIDSRNTVLSTAYTVWVR